MLYGRDNCHLCHDMMEDLHLWQSRRAFEFEYFDIDDAPELQRLYAHMVPVLLKPDFELLCFGRLNVEHFNDYLNTCSSATLPEELL